MRKFANFQKLNEIYSSGELGQLATVWTQRMWFRDFPADYYQASISRSGGLTNELNVHDFDWLRTIGGDVRTVYGRVVRTRPDRDVEENSYSLLNFDIGFGLVGTSWLAAIPHTSAGIVGTQGMALIRGNEVIKKRIDAGERLTDSELRFLKSALEDAHQAAKVVVRHPEVHALGAQIAQLYDEIVSKAFENEKRP
jgi:predicted dehydrogenase